MDCQRIDAILDEHGKGGLSAAERTEIAAHLQNCQRCADAWLADDLVAADTPDGPRPELLRELTTSVFDETRTATRTTSRRFAVRTAVAASVIAISGLAGLLLFGGGSGGPDPVTRSDDLADNDSAIASDLNPVFLSAPAEAIGEFMAGQDYELVRNPSPLLANGTQIHVCEFFMFKCIFCFNFESSLDVWEETLSDDVSLERVPALFNPLARLHAQAFYTAELLGKTRDLQTRFYEEIHLLGNPLDTLDQIRDFFRRNGIPGEEFDRAFASRSVEASMRRAAQLNSLYGVTATPSLGVNGRYLTNPGLTGSNERMLAVIDAIVSDEASSRCDAADGSSCPFE